MRRNYPPPEGHNAEIDLWKLIASIVIMFHHSLYATNTDGSRIWAGGYIFVAFFFCISGYLMANSVFRAAPLTQDNLGWDTVKFMARKIGNIIPWYIVAWIISWLLCVMAYGFVYMISPRTLISSIFPTLLIYMAGFDGFQVLGAIWYLSAMYLCMPALYAILRARKDLFVWVIAPTLSLFVFGWMQKTNGSYGGVASTWLGLFYGAIPYAVAGLSLGCFCYAVTQWLKRQSLTRTSCVLISLLDLGGFMSCLVLAQMYPKGDQSSTVALLFAIVVVTSFSGKSYTTKFINRYCNTLWTRELSIAIYLLNGRTFFILRRFFPDLQGYNQRLLLYVLLTLLISALSVILVRLMKKWYQKTGRSALRRIFLNNPLT